MPFRTRASDPAVAERFASLLAPPRSGGWVPESRLPQEGPPPAWSGPSDEEEQEPWTPAGSWSSPLAGGARPITDAADRPVTVERADVGLGAAREARVEQAGDEAVPEPVVAPSAAPSVVAVLRAGRLDPGRRGVLALVLVGVLAAALAGWLLLRGRPSEQPLSAPATFGASTSGGATSVAGDPGAVVVVDVAGRVRRPGIVRLPQGARVDDALRAAGGLLPGASPGALNLAAKVSDGQQVLVGVAAAVPVAGGGPASGAQVDLNTATPNDLDALPGVGPVLAQRIVDWRTEHQHFASVDQLREVSGIGESKYQALKGKVRV